MEAIFPNGTGYICSSSRGQTERLTHGKVYFGEKVCINHDLYLFCRDDRGRLSTFSASRFIEERQARA
ncbi:MAG: hypothetical protein HFG27_10240 [Provencibacterium sp.]|jgi:hypothetical protein|nr:hypothetical protein [Provencibacterium sp.]